MTHAHATLAILTVVAVALGLAVTVVLHSPGPDMIPQWLWWGR